MREILFRGKRIDNGEWIEGDLYQPHELDPFPHYKGEVYIHELLHGNMFAVIPETVGQYTCRKDDEGKKIFEGDILRVIFDDADYDYTTTIESEQGKTSTLFVDGKFGDADYAPIEWAIEWWDNESAYYEVIGNIHDNPELLKGGE